MYLQFYCTICRAECTPEEAVICDDGFTCQGGMTGYTCGEFRAAVVFPSRIHVYLALTSHYLYTSVVKILTMHTSLPFRRTFALGSRRIRHQSGGINLHRRMGDYSAML